MNYEPLLAKLSDTGMHVLHETTQDGWRGKFYFSDPPDEKQISWLQPYRDYFEKNEVPKNKNHFAAFIFSNGQRCYAISHGKSHFYLRPFCDFDFGIELAKRIAHEGETRQTASRRYQGSRRKDIRSFTANTRLDVESGESLDYIYATLIDGAKADFGQSGKFGTSAQLAPIIAITEIGALLNKIEKELVQAPRFSLPRTTVVSDDQSIQKYDNLLIDELLSENRAADFTHNSYDIYGVDFVFSNEGHFRLWCPGYGNIQTQHLEIEDLRRYVEINKIRREDVLSIKVTHDHEGWFAYTKGIKEVIDFIADEDRVSLSAGKWMQFNQDYLDFLHDYLDGIPVELVESELSQVSLTEPEFNESLRQYGYEVADKDFSILKINAKTPIEAWDHKREDCVYAVKFGPAQKLNYVCDQAVNVLELIRNRATVRKIPSFKKYCLWLGCETKNPIGKISKSGSIILKQKIENWARRCRELGIDPVIKISQKV